jgi:hypothetical protein
MAAKIGVAAWQRIGMARGIRAARIHRVVIGVALA